VISWFQAFAFKWVNVLCRYAKVAALSRRMAEFRVVRHARYGAMARVFDFLEAELSAIKKEVHEYAARV
jgi:hypothetical protein